jgi:response regulator RpfG family c-di-GMP phosphodiesterase
MANGLKPNILIIGDDDAVRRYVQQSFVSGEYRCTSVTSAQEAASATKDVRVDAALLDMASAGFPGLHWAAHLRRSVKNLPIVVVTSTRSAAVALEALSLGATDCLLAPVSSSDLRAAVERAVRWRRAALASEGACDRLARTMWARSAALVRACAESGVGSSIALESWVEALYRHDTWAFGHVRRVADFSVAIATMLGISTSGVQEIGRAALLHDVGRVAVPPELIQKADPLTDDEQTLVRTYVQVNYEAAMALPYLEPLAVTLFTVRERFDGSGYPLGLRGDAIPIESRIVAVAEAFDSLVAGRSDEPPATRANAALVQAAGALFDPAVVHAWLRCLDTGFRRSECY